MGRANGGVAPQLVGCSGARTLPRLGGGAGVLKECYQNGALSNDHVIGKVCFILIFEEGFL